MKPEPGVEPAADAAPPESGTFGLDRFLTYRLHVLNKATDRATNALFTSALGLSLGECRCLAAIGFFPSMSVNELARHANLDKSQASRAAQGLVDRQQVARRPRHGDSRVVDLVLTRSGRATYGRVLALATLRNDQVFGVLSDTERRRLSHLLDKLIAHAAASEPAAP